MGIPTPVETERKFLIERPTEEILSEYESVRLNIVQTYLKRSDPEVERRIRQRGANGEFSYFYTEKKKISSCKRFETEKKISKEEYLALLTEGVSTIRKDRYCFCYKNQYFELDIYPEGDDKAILEIELTEENQEIEIPSKITIIKEVTGDPEYLNANLAK